MKKIILIAFFGFFTSYSYGQFSDCAGAEAGAVVDLNCGANHTYATSSETASGFFGGFSPSCDAGGANQIDFWFKFTAADDDIQVTLETASASTKVVILDNVECGVGTAAEIACMSKGVAGSEDLVAYNTDLVAGNDYYLVVLMDAAEDITNICIKSPEVPNNNECVNALELFAGSTISGSNLSTDAEEFDYACTSGDENYDVWYKFDYTEDNAKKLRISVTPTGGNAIQGNVSLSVYDACEGNELACEVVESNPIIVLGCLPTGMYWIQVASADLNEGDFNIVAEIIDRNVDECNENDECAYARELDINDMYCQWVNTGIACVGYDACPDDISEGGCDLSNGQTVFFKVWVSDGADELDVRLVGLDFADPVMIVMADCAGTNKWCGGETLAAPIDVSGANNQFYYIAVSKTDDGDGNFNIEINIKDFPENDDPCFTDANPPYDLGNDGSHIGTTCCAKGVGEGDENPNKGDCSAATEENIVWYRANVSSDGIEVTVTEAGGGSASGPITVEVYLGGADAACDGSLEYRDNSCSSLPSTPIRVGCLTGYDYVWIKVGTAANTCGSFEISVEAIEDCAVADACTDISGAETADPETVEGTSPEFNDCFEGCLDLSCPESPSPAGGCDYSTNQTVWYQINTDGDAEQLFVNVTPAGSWTPAMSVYYSESGDCGDLSAVSPGCSSFTADPGYYSVYVATNAIYYVAITSQVAIADNPNFEVCFGTIANSIFCVGDDPCMSDPNPPYDLSTDGSHIGSTCCASGVGEGDEHPNQECSSATEENIVWYRASYNSNFDGVEVNVNSVTTDGTSGNVTVEVYVGGEDAICDGDAVYKKSSCTSLPSESIHIGCLEDGDYIWIKIGTSDDNCGKFEINVTQINDCEVADECDDIEFEQTFSPTIVSGTAPVFNDCTEGCLDLSCPEEPAIPGNEGCDFSINPTVWYAVETVSTGQLFVKVTPEGYWTPMVSVYLADPDCSNLINANTTEDPCSSTSVEPGYYSVGVSEGQTYYIAVSASDFIFNANFEICFGIIENTIACIGDIYGCGPDPSFIAEVVNREYPDADDNPDGPFVGPFCPGEELSIHLEFTYDASETNNDWLLGIVPGFSNGFNVLDFNWEANPPIATGPFGGEGAWSESGDSCGPAVMYEPGLGHLGTYIEDGRLKLCNALCEPCDSVGLQKGDKLPGMYSWICEGSQVDCIIGDCSPKRHWGIGRDVVDLSWDFTIRVKEFNDEDSCSASDGLRVDIQTFSDGIAGCWDGGILCALDKKQIGPTWSVNCNFPPKVIATSQPVNICSGQALDLLISTEDGLGHNVAVIHDDLDEVGGMNDYNGDTDLNINDILTLNNPDECNPVTVFYYVKVDEPEYTCSSRWDTIEVNVYPNINLDLISTEVSAQGTNDATATANAICGYGQYSYKWSNGDTTKTISGLSPGKYNVTVTDYCGIPVFDSIVINSYGCSGINFNGEVIDLTCYDYCIGSIKIIDIINGEEPFSYMWNTGDSTKIIDSLCKGTYKVTVTDVDGCEIVKSFNVTSPSKLLSNIFKTDETGIATHDGIAGIAPSGGIPPYKYKWSTGDSIKIIDKLSQGMYFVTITDSLYCTTIDSIFVGGFICNLQVNSQIIDATCFGECDGTIGVLGVENGVKPLKYNWNTGASTALINNLCAGEYIVTITDSIGCNTIDTLIVTQPAMIAFIVDSLINISDESGAIYISIKDAGKYSFSWEGPNGFSKTTQSIFGLDIGGCYTLTIQDTLTNCSIDSTMCVSLIGVEESDFAKSIKIYPNPSTDIFYINFGDINNSNAQIRMFDLSNRKVLDVKKSNENRLLGIDVKNMPKGLYFVEIKLDVGVVYRKIIVD